ncbi:acyl carrier protein [Streptomyces sp. BR1]|uniref:acyl carrier protein n=1 Tax=Streptomyces sp. BR1 TaxID=1592323 RepID=UPI00402B5C5B
MAARAGERAEQVDESGSDRHEEVLAGLADIINEVAGIPVEEVRMGADFAADLDIDSLSMVEVIVAAEEQFDLSIPDAEILHMRTVREAVDYIVKKRALKGR